MASVSSFVQSPTEAILNSCTKDQLLKLVEHYGVDIGDKKLKAEIKGALRASLIESGQPQYKVMLRLSLFLLM